MSIWVVPSAAITASDPSEKAELFEPAELDAQRLAGGRAFRELRHLAAHRLGDKLADFADTAAVIERLDASAFQYT